MRFSLDLIIPSTSMAITSNRKVRCMVCASAPANGEKRSVHGVHTGTEC